MFWRIDGTLGNFTLVDSSNLGLTSSGSCFIGRAFGSKLSCRCFFGAVCLRLVLASVNPAADLAFPTDLLMFCG